MAFVRAPSCHQDSPKHPLVTSGQATDGSSLPRGLSCADWGFGFLLGCSLAESLLPDHLRNLQSLEHFSCFRSGVKSFIYRKSLCILLGRMFLSSHFDSLRFEGQRANKRWYRQFPQNLKGCIQICIINKKSLTTEIPCMKIFLSIILDN